MRRRCWLGLDFGTSSVKALLVGEDGVVAGRGSAGYPTAAGAGGASEQDPRNGLDAAQTAIAASGAADEHVLGVGLAGQTPTLVLVDAGGEPVRPALTWQDHRADAEAVLLQEELGEAEAVFGTRLPWTAAYPPAKLLWLSEHEPDAVARTAYVLQPKDFVGFRLTGSPASDPWSSKGLVHVGTFEPVTEVLERCGFGAKVAPPVAPAWEPRGAVSAGAAEALGLPAGVPVSIGWSDALAAMLAVGAFEEPRAFVLTGTSSIVGASTDERRTPHAGLLELPETCAPLAVHYGPTESSGASIEWLARLLRTDADTVLELAASVDVDAGPLFVPYLSGERAPVWRTDVRAVVLGAGAGHGPAELARAVVDGVCLSEADVLAVARELTGLPPAAVAVAGRGAAGPPWLESRLAALGEPLLVLGEADASALGAAMLGAAASSGERLGAVAGLRGPTQSAEPSRAAAEAAARRVAGYRRAAAASVDWADG
jgi:xylulokinase